MYWTIYLLTFGPPVLAVSIGCASALFLRSRARSTLSRGIRTGLIAGSALALLAFFVWSIAMNVPGVMFLELATLYFAFLDSPFRFVTPFVIGVLALTFVLVGAGSRSRSTTSAAPLSRRSALTFTSKGTLAWVAILTTIAVALAAMLAPTAVPDENGHYRLIIFDSGFMAIGTETYGLYYSVPALIALLTLIALAFFTLRRIALPPISGDFDAAMRSRRLSSHSVAIVVIATLLLHLSQLFELLHAIASVSGASGDPSLGSNNQQLVWSPLSGMEPLFFWTAALLKSASIAVWSFVFVRAICAGRVERNPTVPAEIHTAETTPRLPGPPPATPTGVSQL